MRRLYLFAEGQTEQTFAAKVLSPHLADRGVYMQPPVLVAHARSKGRAHRGGLLGYVPMKNDILRFLSQERGLDVFFTTMIDLYALPSDFPGFDEASRHGDPYSRVEALEQALVADIGDPRFIPFIQLHEFEAYLFANPDWFRYFYDHHDGQIAALLEIAREYATPELINDGPDTAPSKRIIEQFPTYGSAKPVEGPSVAELIGLDTIREQCPHFNKWLTKLETLGE